MISEKIRLQIKSEIEQEMANYDILSLLELLDRLLQADCPIRDIRGVKERYPSAINKIFDINSSMGEIASHLSDYFKVEALFKLLLYYVEPEAYVDRISEVSGFSSILKLLKMNPNNENLNKDRNRIPAERFLRQISGVYKLRNAEAHACQAWGRNELFQNVNDVMVAVLFCISIHKNELEKNIAISGMQSTVLSGIEKYMNELVTFFKQKMKKYIDLNGEENLAVADRYIIETEYGEDVDEDIDEDKEVSEADDTVEKRAGTINEIRRSELPEKKMMIWGEAGTGKSTTLEYLAYADALSWKKDNRENIPVLIPLAVLTSINSNIKSYIAGKFGVTETVVEELLKNGRLNIFIDGLNEIANDAGFNLKSIRLKEIKQLLDWYPNNQFIISNRPSDNVEFNGVPVFLLVKLSDEQLDQFLQKNTKSKETIRIINEAIHKKERLKSIVRTPLMFSRLIDIVEVTGKIPNSEGQIIGAFLDTLFLREKNEKMVAFLDVKKAKYLLRSIAYNGLEDSSTNAGMTEETVLAYMRKCMTTYCFQADSFYMLEIFQQLGILLKRDNLYVFAHQAYQDYYHAIEEMAVLGLL